MSVHCEYCGSEFTAKTIGGSVKRFCSQRCQWAAWCERNPERARAIHRRYEQAHPKTLTPDRRKSVAVRARWKVSGFTEDYYREMLDAQEAVCAICGSEAGPSGFNADHDHVTTQPRGVLCPRCNMGLGLFGDSAETLRLAAEYLQSWAA